MVEPTESMPAAQRSLPSGRGFWDNSSRSMTWLAPRVVKVIRLAGASGRGGHFPSRPREEGDGDGADTTGGAGHERRAGIGGEAMGFQCHHAQHRRVARRADRHGLCRVMPSGRRTSQSPLTRAFSA